MEKEKYYEPKIEVINLSDDIICTSESPFDDWEEGGTSIWD